MKRIFSKKQGLIIWAASTIYLMAVIFIALAIVLPSKYMVPIFMYHNIDEKNELLSVSPKNFERHMKFLRENNFNIISLSGLADLMTQRKKIPPKTVVITLDDGHTNNFTNAYPILKKYNIPATMFVIASHCGWETYLTRGQIKELSQNGIDIGSHTLNDAWLPSRDEKEQWQEIAGSKAALEEITGKKVNLISYPLGGFNQRVRLLVMKAGYKAGCATNPGGFTANNDIYALKRMNISHRNSRWLSIYWFKARGWYMWLKERKPKSRREAFYTNAKR